MRNFCSNASISLVQNIKNVLFVAFWTQSSSGLEVPIQGAGQQTTYYSSASIKSKSIKDAKKVFQTKFNYNSKTIISINGERQFIN